jgi:hypothetical protein
MAVGNKRGSRPAGTEPPAVRGEDGRLGEAAVDGLPLRVACGDEKAFTGVWDQLVGPVYGLLGHDNAGGSAGGPPAATRCTCRG